MKKDQTKSQFKDMKGKAKEVVSKVSGVLEPRHAGDMQNVHSKIEAAYADLRNEYKKAQ